VLPATYKTICSILPSWLTPCTDKITGIDFEKTHQLAIIFSVIYNWREKKYILHSSFLQVAFMVPSSLPT